MSHNDLRASVSDLVVAYVGQWEASGGEPPEPGEAVTFDHQSHGGEDARRRFCDEVARQLALGFASGQLSFDACDDLINDVWGWFLRYDDAAGPPPLFWDVYLAFDGGEYKRQGDLPTDDPEEKYTRPGIERVIRVHHLT